MTVIGIWCLDETAGIDPRSTCVNPPPLIALGATNPADYTDNAGFDIWATDSWRLYKGADYVPAGNPYDATGLNKWKNADESLIGNDNPNASNATQANEDDDDSDYMYDNQLWKDKFKYSRDCRQQKLIGAPMTWRYIRMWTETTIAGKNWRYVVTYLQKLENGVWKIKSLASNCFPIYVIICKSKTAEGVTDCGAPFILPEGCIPPEPPKPPTECEMAYQLGQQLSEQWGSMLVDDMELNSNVTRDNMSDGTADPEDPNSTITEVTEDLENPDFKANFDEGYTDAVGGVQYYDNAVYPLYKTREASGSLTYKITYSCPGKTGGKMKYSASLPDEVGQLCTSVNRVMVNGQPTDEYVAGQAATDCNNALAAQVFGYGGTYEGIVSQRTAAEQNTPAQMVICGIQKIRPGWTDNIRRSYDSHFRSDWCKDHFLTYTSMQNPPTDREHCNVFRTETHPDLVYCESAFKRYCNADRMQCMEHKPEHHSAIADWDNLRALEPLCGPPEYEGGYKQTLKSCYQPDGTKLNNCTAKSDTMNLVDKLKGCFRKELKKGGFTIEKVCLYQSVSKTFKNVADIEAYMEENLNKKKCLKYSAVAVGKCLKWGYAPRLGLKCNSRQVVHQGLKGTETGECYYHYEDKKDQHANDSIILRDYDLAKAQMAFFKGKFERSTGMQLITDYALWAARATDSQCSGHLAIPAKTPQQCITDATTNKIDTCTVYRNSALLDFPSSWNGTAYECFPKSNRTYENGFCKRNSEESKFKNCTEWNDTNDACKVCGNSVRELNKAKTDSDPMNERFVSCSEDTCPEMCSSCQMEVDLETGKEEDITCTSCAVGWFFNGTSGQCEWDEGRLHSKKFHCEVFSTAAANTCNRCLPGFAFSFDNSGVCVEIPTAHSGCISGGFGDVCVCATGFRLKAEFADPHQNVGGKEFPSAISDEAKKAWEKMSTKIIPRFYINEQTADGHNFFDPARACEEVAGADPFYKCEAQFDSHCEFCREGWVLGDNGLCSAEPASGDANWDAWKAGGGANCARSMNDGGTYKCLVPEGDYFVDEDGNATDVWGDEEKIENCMLHVFIEGHFHCYQCNPGYILDNEEMMHCAQLNLTEVRGQHSMSNAIKERHNFGCRYLRDSDGRCGECKTGYWQANPQSNDECVPDNMFNCHKFANANNDQCVCRMDSLARYTNNNNCQAMAVDPIGELKYNELVPAKQDENYDQCNRVNALRLFFCVSYYPLDGSGAANQADATQGVFTTVTQYKKAMNEGPNKDQLAGINAWVSYDKNTSELEKQANTWKQMGIRPDDFCAKFT